MRSVAAIYSICLLVLTCGLSVRLSAQVPEPPVQVTATKLDQFGQVGHCDVTARLDNLAIKVQDTPNAQAHIISYAPPSVGERLLEVITDYLIDSRGVAPERIKTRYGGRNSDLSQPKIELWIVPQNAVPPEPQTYDTNVETFKGRLANEPAREDFGVYSESEMGPGIGGTTDASFADILNQQKTAIGYIVVYSGWDLTPGAWRRIAQQQIDYLKGYNLESGRVKVIFGGHRKETRLELWVLPKDAPPPVRDAGPERPLGRTVKAGDFFGSDLANEQNQTNLFTRLTEILRAQKSVRAFLVVRLEVPTPEQPSDGVDLTKLVEKWRLELANTHKIGAERLIVLFTTAGEMESNHLSLWIVPKGQPLPDPHPKEEQEEPDH